jgi:hydroxymethylbilane synthase
VATGSVRRHYQLRCKNPQIQVVDLRGNVPTRLRKLATNDWDAIVLARAGVERLGYDLSDGSFSFEDAVLHAEILPLDEFVPAGGQGVIAMQVRSSDEKIKTIVSAVSDADTLSCLRAEREFLRLLQGDCDSPVGVLATIDNWQMTLRAQVFTRPDEPPKTGKVFSSLREQAAPEKISAVLHAWMYGQK